MHEKTKISPGYRSDFVIRYPSNELVRECLLEVVVNNFLVRPAALYLLYPYIATAIAIDTSALPSTARLVFELACCIAVDDTWFYWVRLIPAEHTPCHV